MLPSLRRAALVTAVLPLVLVGGVAPAVGSDPGTPPPVAGIDPETAGLAGPVGDVLEDAPESGRVPLVVTSTGPDGVLAVDRQVASDRDEAAELVQEARRDDTTLSVSVEQVYHAVGTDDPLRGEQWALSTLAAEQVWPTATGLGVKVAVIDTGVDGSHPDLVGALGPGADFVDGGNGRTDPDGHGTHVAGIIAARAGNGIGIAGLAPEATVLPVRVLDASGSGTTTDVVEGVRWAVDVGGAKVLNLSLGSGVEDPALQVVLAYARQQGAVVVAAVGNSGAPCTLDNPVECGNPVLYPGASEGVIGVGATDAGNRRAAFSEHGPQVDVVAPGVAIVSTYRWGRYVALRGTSMATPYAAATVALLRSAEPSLTVDQVESRLTSTALDLGAPGRDNDFGHGLVQPAALLGLQVEPTVPSPTPKPVTTSTRVAVSATTVRPGTVVTAAASVTASGGRVSGPAQICLRRLTATTPRCTAVTATDGRAALRLTVPVGSVVTARFLGTPTHSASTSAGVRVAVVPWVTATGGTRRLTVRVSTAQRQRATVQRLYRSGWRSVKAFTVTSSNRFTVTGLRAGTYRVTVAASVELQASKSASVRVR